jgi:hypothetical protein
MSLGRQNACLTKAQMGLLTEAGNMGRPCTQLGQPLASLPLGPSLDRLFLLLLAGSSASLAQAGRAQGARSIGAQEALAPLRRLTAWKFCPEPSDSPWRVTCGSGFRNRGPYSKARQKRL